MPKNLRIIDVKPQNEAVIDVIPKNQQALDVLPRNEAIIDFKPQNEAVIDVLPKMRQFATSDTEQYYTIVIGRGMPIGLLLALTYPSNITISSSYSP